MTFGLVEILGGIAGIAFLIMSMMVKSSRSGKKAAEAERDIANKALDEVVKVNQSHVKSKEIDDAIKKAVEDTRDTPVTSRRASLLNEAKNYHGDKS